MCDLACDFALFGLPEKGGRMNSKNKLEEIPIRPLLYMATSTNQHVYGWITVEIIILATAFYWLVKSQKKPFAIW